MNISKIRDNGQTILKFVKSPYLNKRSRDFDETWASGGRTREPI